MSLINEHTQKILIGQYLRASTEHRGLQGSVRRQNRDENEALEPQCPDVVSCNKKYKNELTI